MYVCAQRSAKPREALVPNAAAVRARAPPRARHAAAARSCTRSARARLEARLVRLGALHGERA
jgi:hypothetical protein